MIRLKLGIPMIGRVRDLEVTPLVVWTFTRVSEECVSLLQQTLRWGANLISQIFKFEYFGENSIFFCKSFCRISPHHEVRSTNLPIECINNNSLSNEYIGAGPR